MTKNKDILLTFILLFAFIVSFFVDKFGVIRVILGFLFVLFLPGYSLTSICLPPNTYNDVERLTISFGLSIALSPLLSLLMLKFVGSASILPCLAFLVSSLSLLAYYRRLRTQNVEINSNINKDVNSKSLNRKIVFISIASGVLMVIITYYFKFFPTIGNPLISDLLITILIFSFSLLLIFGSFLVKSSREIYCILPLCLIFAFIARSVMYLRLPYPPLWDPYAFLVAFLNVHIHHTLDPILTWWLPQLDGILPWPLMLLTTESLVLATGLDYMHLFRFQEPFLGTLFFLAIYILAREVTKNDGVAILASLFSSLASNVVFYQSEYHAQGLVFVLLVFLIYSIIKSLNSEHAISYRIIALIFIPAIVLSHYFSSLFLAVIFATLLFMTNALAVLERKIKKWSFIIIGDALHNALFLAIVSFTVSYHIYSYSKHFEGYIKAVFSIPHPYQAEIIAIGAPFPTNIIKSMRVVLLILALISVLYIWRTKNIKEFYLATFWLSFIIFGVIGNYFIWLEVGRITAFYETVTGVFGALTLFRLRDKWIKGINSHHKTVIAVLIASSIITCSFFGGTYVPAYYFKSFGVNEYYWCLNRLPNMDAYPPAGKWIKTYTSIDAKYIVDSYGKYGFTSSLVFFWGTRSPEKIIGTNTPFDYMLKNVAPGEQIYLVLNAGYKYQNLKNFLNFSNLIYTNGEIEIFTR